MGARRVGREGALRDVSGLGGGGAVGVEGGPEYVKMAVRVDDLGVGCGFSLWAEACRWAPGLAVVGRGGI